MEEAIEALTKEILQVIRGEIPQKRRKELPEEINLRFFQMIIFGFHWTSLTSKTILRMIGEKIAQKISTHSKSSDLQILLEEIKKIYEKFQVGKIEIEILPQQKIAHFRIKENAEAIGAKNFPHPICAFTEGFIEGYLKEVLFKKESLSLISGEEIYKIKVEELECTAQGKGYCDFMIYFQ